MRDVLQIVNVEVENVKTRVQCHVLKGKIVIHFTVIAVNVIKHDFENKN